MENYRIVELHDNKLKVYRDGRIEKYFIYKRGSKDKKYKKGDIIWKLVKQTKSPTGYVRIGITNNESVPKFFSINRVMAYTYLNFDLNIPHTILPIDHINSIRDDNRIENLQILTPRQNTNKQKQVINAKGYWFVKSRNRYQVQIKVSGKRIYLGTFKTEICARYAKLTAKNHYDQF